MTIQETIRKYIMNERFPDRTPVEFDDDYDLIDSGTINSLFMVSLITYIEDQYKVEFGMNDIVPRHFRSVNALADFVRSRAASDQCRGAARASAGVAFPLKDEANGS